MSVVLLFCGGESQACCVLLACRPAGCTDLVDDVGVDDGNILRLWGCMHLGQHVSRQGLGDLHSTNTCTHTADRMIWQGLQEQRCLGSQSAAPVPP